MESYKYTKWAEQHNNPDYHYSVSAALTSWSVSLLYIPNCSGYQVNASALNSRLSSLPVGAVSDLVSRGSWMNAGRGRGVRSWDQHFLLALMLWVPEGWLLLQLAASVVVVGTAWGVPLACQQAAYE